MSPIATNGGIALAVMFVLVLLSVLGWRHPQSFGSRLILGIIIATIGVGAFIYLSGSVTAFVEEIGLAKSLAEVQKK